MSSVLGPNGQPARQGPDRFQQVLLGFAHRIEQSQQQIIQLGLLVEFLVHKVQTSTHPDGSPLIVIGDTEFGEWTQERFAEIQREAAMVQETAANQPDIRLEE